MRGRLQLPWADVDAASVTPVQLLRDFSKQVASVEPTPRPLLECLNIVMPHVEFGLFSDLRGRGPITLTHGIRNLATAVCKLVLAPLACHPAGLGDVAAFLQRQLEATVVEWSRGTQVVTQALAQTNYRAQHLFRVIASLVQCRGVAQSFISSPQWEFLWVSLLYHVPEGLKWQLLRLLRFLWPLCHSHRLAAALAVIQRSAPFHFGPLLREFEASVDTAPEQLGEQLCYWLLRDVERVVLTSEPAAPSAAAVVALDGATVGTGHALTQIAIESANLLRVLQRPWYVNVGLGVVNSLYPRSDYNLVTSIVGVSSPDRVDPAKIDAIDGDGMHKLKRALAWCWMLGGSKDIIRVGGHVKVCGN